MSGTVVVAAGAGAAGAGAAGAGAAVVVVVVAAVAVLSLLGLFLSLASPAAAWWISCVPVAFLARAGHQCQLWVDLLIAIVVWM